MSEFLVLFRTPLGEDSPLQRLLRHAGWQFLTESVYYCRMDAPRDRIVAQLKALCSSVGKIAGRNGLCAFSVVCIDTHLKVARQRRRRAQNAAIDN